VDLDQKLIMISILDPMNGITGLINGLSS
jgi:hypothetical protein